MHNAQFLALALIACEGTQIFLNCTKLGVRFLDHTQKGSRTSLRRSLNFEISTYFPQKHFEIST